MVVDLQKLQEDVCTILAEVQLLKSQLCTSTISQPIIEESPLTVQQAADLLDVTTATIYDLVHKRRIPSHRPGKRLYFLRPELMDWIRNGRRMTTDELAISAGSRLTRQSNTPKKGKNA